MKMRVLTRALFLLLVSLFVSQIAGAQSKPRVYKVVYMNGSPVYYYGTIDEDPTFRKGGMAKFHSWFRGKRDTKGPLEPGTRIDIQFIVNADGSIGEMEVSTSPAREKSKVEKIMTKMPKWTPGKHNGQPVNTLVRHKIIIVDNAMD